VAGNESTIDWCCVESDRIFTVVTLAKGVTLSDYFLQLTRAEILVFW